jgi:hypothetical protein
MSQLKRPVTASWAATHRDMAFETPHILCGRERKIDGNFKSLREIETTVLLASLTWRERMRGASE